MTRHQTPLPRRDDPALLGRLVGGDVAAEAEVVAAAADSGSVGVVVAAAVLTGSSEHLVRAAALARGTKERQLVVLARAHVEGATELFDGLVRDHLAGYPDHLVAAWIATRPMH